MAETCRQVLRDCGVNPDRLALEWASAAEGPRFVELVTAYVSRMKAMGPLGEGEGEPGREVVDKRLAAAAAAAGVPKVRTALGNFAKKIHETGDYAKDLIVDGVSAKVLPAFHQERLSQGVRLVLGGGAALGLREISDLAGGEEEEVRGILDSLAKKGLVKETGSGWATA